MQFSTFLAFTAALFLALPGACRGASPANDIVAFSLERARQQAQRHGDRLRHDLTLGLTDVIGFIRYQDDCIVLGRARANGTILGPDELAQLFRAAAVGGLSGPGVSLEPDTPNSFKAVYFGSGTDKTWIGAVSYAGDFICKEIALGLRNSGVPGLQTYADRIVNQMKSSTQDWNVLSRFWFVPAWMPMFHSADSSLWLLKRAEVGVFVQNLSAEIGGVAQANYEDSAAHQFSVDLMSRFDELEANREFADIRAMMGSLQVAAILLQNDPPACVDYWSKQGYDARPISCRSNAPVLRRLIQASARGQIELHGGVRAAGLAIRLAHKDLGALKEIILEARPSDRTRVAWRIHLDSNFLASTEKLSQVQQKTALGFVEANRLRELRQFGDAAREFDKVAKIVPEAVEARFLAAVCRREALVASAKVDQLERPVEELSSLSAQYPAVPEIKYEWAVSLGVLGKDSEALPILENLVDQQPDYLPALHALAMSHYRLGHRAVALKYFSRFVQASGDSPWADEARRMIVELTAPPSEGKPVDYNNGLFSCQRLSTWNLVSGANARRLLSGTSTSSHIDVAFESPAKPACNVVISVAPFPLESLTREQAEASLSKIEATHRAQCQNYNRIEAGAVEINGVVGVRFIFTHQSLGNTVKQCVTTVVHASRSVTITCTAPETDFDNLCQPAFRLANDVHFEITH